MCELGCGRRGGLRPGELGLVEVHRGDGFGCRSWVDAFAAVLPFVLFTVHFEGTLLCPSHFGVQTFVSYLYVG